MDRAPRKPPGRALAVRVRSGGLEALALVQGAITISAEALEHAGVEGIRSTPAGRQ
ncbi:MAG: hypothetical protein M3Z95_08100 [Actinomycetota bacterium]|nr:hypothetical protein [Actinomycetota bacterium]